MSNATAVAQHLPFLRRYARAITGTQTSGDAYVAAVLEAIVEDPTAECAAGQRAAIGASPDRPGRMRANG
jgi:DNA-directed RNA polymerase specialized sigma24 family protein